MTWGERQTVKKGNLGESIVDDYLLDKGVVPYQPVADKAHPFDRLCATQNKQTLFVAEVKTKAARRYYPDTGIDLRHYNDYMNIWHKYGLDVWLFFVDEHAGRVYGNKLSQLIIDRCVIHKGKTITYPLKEKPIIYFPLVAMVKVCDITEENRVISKEMSTRAYEYGD